MCAAGSEKVRVGRGIKFDEDATCKRLSLSDDAEGKVRLPVLLFGLPRSDETQGLHDVGVFHLPKSATTIKSNFHLLIAILPSAGDM
jgi:hypothetical protein